ncbi:MAG: hypothetical protein MPL62_13685 [Alphaproteobacteria bacterium]|nr:hypothetical protein [Alphaproteobacteria bacterium]
MKKLQEDYSLRQKRIIADRIKRKTRGKAKKKARDEKQRLSNYRVIPAPETILLQPNFGFADGSIGFVNDIGELARTEKRVLLDFSDTKFMSALGSVYLYSEINNIIDSHGTTVRIKGHDKMRRQVRNLLRNSGILQLCGYLDEPDPDAFFPIRRGDDDKDVEKITRGVVARRKQTNLDDPNYAESLTYKAISEAMLNVKQHAYPTDNNRFWWATAAISKEDIHIALCDRGVGIPQTLSTSRILSNIVRGLSLGNDDAKMIQAAMVYTRSSRQEGFGTGLGSRDIQNLVLDEGKGHLTIISGKGHYRLNGDNTESIEKISYDVGGTLIQWQIPLKRSTGGRT